MITLYKSIHFLFYKQMYRAIIVESRIHNALPFVLQNFNENLSDEWSILVFHKFYHSYQEVSLSSYFISLKT